MYISFLFSVFRTENLFPVYIGRAGKLGEEPVNVEDWGGQALDVGRDFVDRPLLANPEQHFETIVNGFRKRTLRKRSDCLRRDSRIHLSLQLNEY